MLVSHSLPRIHPPHLLLPTWLILRHLHRFQVVFADVLNAVAVNAPSVAATATRKKCSPTSTSRGPRTNNALSWPRRTTMTQAAAPSTRPTIKRRRVHPSSSTAATLAPHCAATASHVHFSNCARTRTYQSTDAPTVFVTYDSGADGHYLSQHDRRAALPILHPSNKRVGVANRSVSKATSRACPSPGFQNALPPPTRSTISPPRS